MKHVKLTTALLTAALLLGLLTGCGQEKTTETAEPEAVPLGDFAPKTARLIFSINGIISTSHLFDLDRNE